MNSTRLLFSLGASLLLSGLLAGCAADGQMAQHHQGGYMAQGQGSTMDMQSMCSMHKEMMAGKTAPEQRALMDEHMKSMTPEMRQRMQTMMEQCK